MNLLLSKFKALSDRNRLRVIAALLSQEELCACQIVELLQVTGATASRHMGVLLSSGLVESRKDGRWVHYKINTQSDAFVPILQWMRQVFENDEEILKDRELLSEIATCDLEELCRRQRGIECCP